MDWIVMGGMVVGLPVVAQGAATVRTGWTPPRVRRHVARPRVHGLGALLVGTPVLVQGLFCFRFLPDPSWEPRFFGTTALLLCGLILLTAGQVPPPGARRGPGPGAG